MRAQRQPFLEFLRSHVTVPKQQYYVEWEIFTGGSGAVPENVSEASGTREGLGKNGESVSLQRLEQDSVT